MSKVKLHEKDFWNHNPTDPPIIPSSEIEQTAIKEKYLYRTISQVIFKKIRNIRLPRVHQQFSIGTKADWD